MARILPTLSSSGWAIGDMERIDRALANILLTDGLQSNIHRDNLTSIPDLIQRNLNDKASLQINTQNRIEDYFKKLFDDALVSVEVKELEGKVGHLNLIIRATVTIGIQKYDIARTALSINGKFKEVQNIVNA